MPQSLKLLTKDGELMKNKDYFLLAHVEVDDARFYKSGDLTFEFRNKIDAWNKMQIAFRNQIRNPRAKKSTLGKSDLHPYYYSIRTIE